MGNEAWRGMKQPLFVYFKIIFRTSGQKRFGINLSCNGQVQRTQCIVVNYKCSADTRTFYHRDEFLAMEIVTRSYQNLFFWSNRRRMYFFHFAIENLRWQQQIRLIHLNELFLENICLQVELILHIIFHVSCFFSVIVMKRCSVEAVNYVSHTCSSFHFQSLKF